jgi:hypothetical protein
LLAKPHKGHTGCVSDVKILHSLQIYSPSFLHLMQNLGKRISNNQDVRNFFFIKLFI